MNQKGFIPIILLVGVVFVGAASAVFYVVKSPIGPKTSISSQERESIIPSIEIIESQPAVEVTYAPTVRPTRKPSPLPTKVSKNSSKNSNYSSELTETPTLVPTQTPVPQPSPIPTISYSNIKPNLTVTGPYTIGESGPCFDLKSLHPYSYSQSADYKFDENENNYRYTTLRLEVGGSVGTVCWIKDQSKTGLHFVFKARSYTDSTPEKIYSDEANLSYTHP